LPKPTLPLLLYQALLACFLYVLVVFDKVTRHFDLFIISIQRTVSSDGDGMCFQHLQYDALVFAAAMTACQDSDKVQVNGVRTIGNLLAIQQLPSAVFTASHATNSCSQWWGEAWLDQGISCLHTSLASSTEKVCCLHVTCVLRL